MKILLLILLIIALPANAGAKVAISVSAYNDQDDFSMGLSGENINFDSSTVLMPDSIFYNNGGKSNKPSGFYDYSIALNGNTLKSGASTNSGGFSWDAIASSNYAGSNYNGVRLSATSFTYNGLLKSYSANNKDKIDETIETENAAYKETTAVTSNSLSLTGKGSSTKSDCAYSHQQNLNDDPLESAVTTNSGAFAWGVNAKSDTSSKSDEHTISTRSIVVAGSLTTTLANQDQTVNNNVGVSGGIYQEQSMLSSSSIYSQGFGQIQDQSKKSDSGSTATADSQTDQDSKSLAQALSVTGVKNQGKIATEVAGATAAQWSSGVKSSTSQESNEPKSTTSFGISVTGYSVDPDNPKLGMVGTATGFPTQILPPGTLQVSETITPSELKDMKDMLKSAEAEHQAFDNEYNPVVPTSFLWYYLDQKTYVNPINEPLIEGQGNPGTLYHMNIGFTMKNNWYM